MYVLFCPCILTPSLRAEGITRESDLVAFAKARERCEKFGIDIVSLPCPETLCIGAGRKPGTFLARLDTLEFIRVLGTLEREVRARIAERGPPLCIIGVNSSPACGVTSTYYGSTGSENPKRAGRGVFLKRFSDIPAVDVLDFARYRVYLAGPLFSSAERSYNEHLARLLRDNMFDVYLPQEIGDDTHHRSPGVQQRLFSTNRDAIDATDIVVAVIEGADADSGTAWEMGYAHAKGKPVVALRTDFRRAGIHEQVNLMLEQSSAIVGSTDALFCILKSPIIAAGRQ